MGKRGPETRPPKQIAVLLARRLIHQVILNIVSEYMHTLLYGHDGTELQAPRSRHPPPDQRSAAAIPRSLLPAARQELRVAAVCGGRSRLCQASQAQTGTERAGPGRALAQATFSYQDCHMHVLS